MQLQCPCCDAIFNIEEGFTAIEGKKLAALLAGVEPLLGKAILSYLRLFSSTKRGLKLTKAIKLVDDLLTLVKTGTVMRDARTNEAKKATIEIWVAAIEQMIEQRDKLTLPLSNHNYLRAVTWNIASDPAQAITIMPKAEQTPTIHKNEEYSKIMADLRLGRIDKDEADRLTQELLGGNNGSLRTS